MKGTNDEQKYKEKGCNCLGSAMLPIMQSFVIVDKLAFSFEIADKGVECVITGLVPGHSYNVSVRAYIGTTTKKYSNSSNIIVASLLSAPAKVTGITTPAAGKIYKPTAGRTHYIKTSWYSRAGSGYQVKSAKNSKYAYGVKTYNVSSKYNYKTISNLKKESNTMLR